jgi:hypothetical protein
MELRELFTFLSTLITITANARVLLLKVLDKVIGLYGIKSFRCINPYKGLILPMHSQVVVV